MLEYFEQLVGGLEAKLTQTTEGPIARKRFALEIAKLGVRLYTPGQKIAWCGVMAPYDLLTSMGVTSCFVEFIGAMLASTGTVEQMIESAEESGFATDTCSYHRSVCGAAGMGLMPEPDFMIATTAPCIGGMAAMEHLAHKFGKEMFVIHVPQPSERAVAELADQYRAMVDFVAQRTGQALDMDRLRQTIEYSNQARLEWIAMNKAAAAVPSPARRRDLVNFGIVMSLFLGTPEAVEIARTFREEFEHKIQKGESGIENESVRLMWLQNRIQFKNPVEAFLEDNGAAVVLDELNEVFWEAIDPDQPFDGMARRCLGVPLTGSAKQRIEGLQKMAKAYNVDGAVNPCHWGCRQGTGSRGLLEDGLRQIDVPVMNLEVDCIDPRHFAEGQLNTRLQAFIEMLKEKKNTASA